MSGRLQILCSKIDPWDRKERKGVQVAHADAVEVGQRDGYPGGDIADYECPNCGHCWSMELPQ